MSHENVMGLVNSYNVLYDVFTLKRMLQSVLHKPEIEKYNKLEIHSLFNEIIYAKSTGESKIKALLVKAFVNEKVTAAFEIKTLNSRVDFLRVNGNTISYEIKSNLDTLTKLAKQTSEYEKLFEFNYIVVDTKHIENAKKVLPKHYGIIVVEGNDLKEIKKAKKNHLISAKSQLKVFTKKELENTFREPIKDLNTLLKTYTAKEINSAFNAMLKKRYHKRWTFLVANKDNIYPIDYQFFFQHNISPSIIYNC